MIGCKLFQTTAVSFSLIDALHSSLQGKLNIAINDFTLPDHFLQINETVSLLSTAFTVGQVFEHLFPLFLIKRVIHKPRQ